jgi:hypothetical protein
MTSTVIPSRLTYMSSQVPTGCPSVTPLTLSGSPVGDDRPPVVLRTPAPDRQSSGHVTAHPPLHPPAPHPIALAPRQPTRETRTTSSPEPILPVHTTAPTARGELNAPRNVRKSPQPSMTTYATGPLSSILREMAPKGASASTPAPPSVQVQQPLSNGAPAVDATRPGRVSTPATLITPTVRGPGVDEQKHLIQSGLSHFVGGSPDVEERKQNDISTITTVLHADEIADLQRFHDNSLAASTRRPYQSDYESFVDFLRQRFPRLSIESMQTQCTLEHVLAYLNQPGTAKRSAPSIDGFPLSRSISFLRCLAKPLSRAVAKSRLRKK